MRGPGRPHHPATEEDCRRWLAEELERVTLRYHEKLEQLRLTQRACDIIEDLVAVYERVGDGRIDESVQAQLLDQAFMRRHVVLEPHVLVEIDAPRIMVADEGGPVRYATSVVSKILNVSKYAIDQQRAHRAREHRTVVDTLARRNADEEPEERCA